MTAPEHTPPESNSPAFSRKLILTVSGLMAGAIVAALFIGRTPPPRREKDKREQEVNFPKPPLTPLAEAESWFEVPNEVESAPGAVLPLPESPGANPPGELVKTGTPPATAVSPAAPTAVAANAPPASPTSPGAEAGSMHPPTAPSAAAIPPGSPSVPALAQNGNSSSAPSAPETPAPTPASVPTQPSTSRAPAVAAVTPVTPASASPSPSVADAKSARPSPSQPASAPPQVASSPAQNSTAPARSVTTTAPVTAVAPSTAPASPRVAYPALRKPRAPRPGIAAQSSSLITRAEYTPPSQLPVPVSPASAAAPAAVAATSDKSLTKDRDAAPAEVTLPEARAYTARLTDSLRQSGTLSATRTVRLPTKAETSNPRVWRQDDTPATPQETRPFGVVVEESDPAARAALASEAPAVPAAQPTHTPEGIPLRTDIPAGTSPLGKPGPDKPLWKRP